MVERRQRRVGQSTHTGAKVVKPKSWLEPHCRFRKDTESESPTLPNTITTTTTACCLPSLRLWTVVPEVARGTLQTAWTCARPLRSRCVVQL
jgi:hypothetical protein